MKLTVERNWEKLVYPQYDLCVLDRLSSHHDLQQDKVLTEWMNLFFLYQHLCKWLSFIHITNCSKKKKWKCFAFKRWTYDLACFHSSISEHPSVPTAHQERDGQLHNLSSLSVTSEPQITNVPAAITEAEAEELSESPESLLLARRERSEAEVQVETLARELVSRDEALAPLLDIWASTTTLDLMQDIFPSCSSAPRHQVKNSSSHTGDR